MGKGGKGKGGHGRGGDGGGKGRDQSDRGRDQGDRGRGQGDRGRDQGDRGRDQGDRGRGRGDGGRGGGGGGYPERQQHYEQVRIPPQETPNTPAPFPTRPTPPKIPAPESAPPKMQSPPPAAQPTAQEASKPKQPRQQAQQGPSKQKQSQPPSQKPSQPPPGKSTELCLKSQLKMAPGGKKGRPIDVYANHFSLNIDKKLKKVYQYDVAIDPDRPKNQMRLVMEAFRQLMYPDMLAAFDGSKILFTTKPLPNDGNLSSSLKIKIDDRDKEYKVAIQFASIVDMDQVGQFYKQVAAGNVVDAPQITLQVIDVVLRHTLSLRQICVGRSFFSVPTGATIRLGNGMHMYRGMYQSAILGGKPFLNVDVSNKAFPAACNVIDIIKDFGDERRPMNLQQQLHDRDLERLSKFVRTLKVVYEIPKIPSSRRVYRVNKAVSNSRDYTFKKDNGQTMTIMEYFGREKGYPIQFPLMPLLHVGARDSRIFVPCELCKIMPGQAVNRKCDADQTRCMIKECARDTNYRKQGIMDNVRRANYNSDAVIREFGLSVSGEMEKITARVLQPPVVAYQSRAESVRRGVWNAQPFYTPAEIKTGWTILCLDNYVKPQDIQRFISLAINTGRSLGMNLQLVKEFKKMQLSRNREFNDLEKYFREVKQMQIALVFVVLPNLDFVYNLVKKASEISVGCLTQCIKNQTFLRRMNEMTMKNILLKVNAKLNGANHILQTPPAILKKPAMLMGADVTHPAPDVENGFSVAAVTASHDPHAFKYNICWRLQPPTREMIDDMESIMKEQLLYFYRTLRVKPEKIVMFRDGVSTGQFEDVLSYEMLAIQRACAKLDPNYKPLITFVVVQKRHHTRFFPVDARISEDKNCNVPAGTVVDKVIVNPSRQDFYMVSHASIQGVAKPTKYVTLWDDNNFNDDDMEELTYYLCHMFARCTRSVSYPAPTYYAHLAAARGKAYCDTQRIDVTNLPKMHGELNIKTEIVKDLPMFFV